jgi:hypothetical protein
MIFTRSLGPVAALAYTALATPIQVASSELDKRQNTGIGAGLALTFAKWINAEWTGETPACSYNWGEGESYWRGITVPFTFLWTIILTFKSSPVEARRDWTMGSSLLAERNRYYPLGTG